MKITIKSLVTAIAIIVILFSDVRAQMYWNQAANFPGTIGSYVSVPSSSTLNLTGSFTLEAWINPSSPAIIGKGIIVKSTGLNIRYGMRILSGRIFVLTNATQRLSSRASNSIPLNKWTHVATTYNSTSGLFSIFINGILDTSATIAGAAPLTNSDSLFIGTNGSSTEFAGKIDEVRIWNTNLSQTLIRSLLKSSLGISGDGLINNLVLSIPFQNNTGSGSLFSAMDYSDKSNNGFLRNVTAFDLKDRPSRFHQDNDCIFFSNTSNVALTAQDNPSISPTSKLTIEFWLFPHTDNYGLLFKGSYSTSFADYGLKVTSGKLNAFINNTLIISNDSVKKDRWSHIAFTYFGATGKCEFYINGKRVTTGSITPGNIIDGSDSLLIGAYPLTSPLLGFMDELRITCDLKTIGEINDHLFTSVNESNDNDASLNAVYNLDASTLPNTDGGPRLNLRSGSTFTFNGTGVSDFESYQSPVNNFSSGQFQSGYYLNMPVKRIPAAGTTGIIKDTIDILSSETISDINIYVAINHNRNSNLRLLLTNPVGTSTEFFANISLADSASSIVTVFDSDADSSLISNRYINFGPKIKPLFDIDAIFSGSDSKGKWILSITDEGGADTGSLISWGLQINNNNSLPFILECTSLIEGFYNSSSDLLITDSVRYYLRSSIFPFSLIDSSKVKLDSSGFAKIFFTKAEPLTDYFLVLKHRNSIETWSSTVIRFSQFSNQAQYDFTGLSSKAFGNNMQQVDTSPVKFALYSGDIDQNGFVDLNDIALTFNDASVFLSGYNDSDVNGDNLTDLLDVLLVFNNSSAFVTSITPFDDF